VTTKAPSYPMSLANPGSAKFSPRLIPEYVGEPGETLVRDQEMMMIEMHSDQRFKQHLSLRRVGPCEAPLVGHTATEGRS